MVPHSGVGGCAPMPRKPSAAASRMALEKDSVACTISGATQLGRIVTSISRRWPAPATLAEITYSRFFSAITAARVSRAKCGCSTSAMASMALNRPGPRIATSTSASSSDGKARMMSMMRMISVSTQPRK